MIDYYSIGQRIRIARKRRGWSQEMLAEKVEISSVHISHIETGNAKLSLPVLVNVADALDVTVDSLLSGVQRASKAALRDEIAALIEDSDPATVRLMVEVCDTIKREAERAKGLQTDV